MTDNENINENDAADPAKKRNSNIGALADDIAHPFDQTNGIIEGLEGDADDPETVNRESGTPAAVPVAAPGSGQFPGAAVIDPDPGQERAADDVERNDPQEP